MNTAIRRGSSKPRSPSTSLQRSVVIQKLQEKLFILKGRTVALLGLAFKPNTDDLRDAPSLQIAEKLIQMGARVRAYDPIAMSACREQNPSICASATAMTRFRPRNTPTPCVLVTEWPEFAGSQSGRSGRTHE